MPDVFLDHVSVRDGMETRMVEPITSVPAASVLIVNVNSFELVPFILPARKGDNYHRFVVGFVLKVDIERKLRRGHYHEHEVVRAHPIPHSQHFEHIPR